ncbi:MAG TPA: Imm50 family immunity protein [Paludibacteraceae bacterium]|nr:Imm50 family immunity protein [Paludibacteraceae bacterium]HQJ90794.1 Imm50 family immunity protein [Paludibacteraceae bacterium]
MAKKWLDFIDDNRAIKALYNGKEPDLSDVSITNVDMHGCTLILDADFYDFPDPLPSRWIGKDYNAVTIRFEMQIVKYKTVEFNCDYKHLSINMESKGEDIAVKIEDKKHKVTFLDFLAKYMEVENIKGKTSK